MDGQNFIPLVRRLAPIAACALALVAAGSAQADECTPLPSGCLLDSGPEAVFVAGSETVPDSWVLAPAAFVSPAKADITASWLEVDGTVLLGALTRASEEGSTLAALELNQRPPGYRESGGVPLPTRTEGDRLLTFALGPHGVEAGLCRWQGDEHAGSWLPLDLAAPSAGNSGCSTGGAVAGASGHFAEAALDLAASGTPTVCHAWFHTRSSDPVTSSPRDLTAVTALPAAPGCTPPPLPPVEEVAAFLPEVARSGLPRPEAGKTVNVYPLRGRVRVKKRGSRSTRELGEGEQIPVGSLVDATDGEVRLVSARGTVRGTQSGEFSEGAFEVRQARGRNVVTELVLSGNAGAARAAAATKKRPRLWGKAKGRFKTTGKHAAATVRGTRWLIEERPNGTYIRVVEGIVSVRDFIRPWTVLVGAGETYLTRRRPPRAR